MGDWKEGKEHGRGEIIYINGDTYNGSWKNGQRDGQSGQLIETKRKLKLVGRFEKNEL